MRERTFTTLAGYNAWLQEEGAWVQVGSIVFNEGLVTVTYDNPAPAEAFQRIPALGRLT